MLRRVVELARAGGISPDDADLTAIETTQARIVELTAILADRHAQQLIVEQEQREAAARAEVVTESRRPDE